MKHILRMWDGIGERVLFLGLRPISIGRKHDCTWVVQDPSMSKEHVRISHTPSGYRLEDLQSTNGTRVNDIVVRSTILIPGDVIQVGNSSISFGTSPRIDFFCDEPNCENHKGIVFGNQLSKDGKLLHRFYMKDADGGQRWLCDDCCLDRSIDLDYEGAVCVSMEHLEEA